MGILLALLSALGYALNNVLMTRMYRRLDPISASCYRGLALGISMSPLLLIPVEGAAGSADTLGQSWPFVLGAAACCAVANPIGAHLFRVYSVGVATALCMGALVTALAVMGIVVFGEMLTPGQYACVAFLVFASARLVIRPGESAELGAGMLSLLAYGVLTGGAFTFVSAGSRLGSPLAVGYAWEVCTGLLLLVVGFGRFFLTGRSLAKVSPDDALRILLYSSPTALGTGCYALATRTAPIAIVSAVVSTQLVFGALLSVWVHQERLTRSQLALVLAVLVGVIAMKLVS